MAKTYRLTFGRRLTNRLLTLALRLGILPGTTYLLSVRGRKSGRTYTTPVTLVERGNDRWLVAPYGEVGWVRNARAAGQVTLSRGQRSETLAISEVGPEEGASVLREYLTHVPAVRPYFDVTPASTLEAFATEAPRHPVFRLTPVPGA